MRLFIVTINYNDSENTLKLLKSLSDQSDGGFQVVIIDNASEDKDFGNLKETLANTFSNASFTLVRNAKNLGFSGGNNVGVTRALKNGADWVLLLNNDTWVDKGFIERLKAVLSQKRGILGIALDEGDRIAYCGRVNWLKFRGYHIYDKNEASIVDGKYVIGGAMAIHRDVINKIGLLDEKYFLYFEDEDYSIRSLKNGFSLFFTDEIVVHHQVSSSTKKLGSPILLRYHYRNALYFNQKNGSIYIKILVWPWSCWILMKQLLKILSLIHQEESRQIMAGVLDFWFSRMGKIK